MPLGSTLLPCSGSGGPSSSSSSRGRGMCLRRRTRWAVQLCVLGYTVYRVCTVFRGGVASNYHMCGKAGAAISHGAFCLLLSHVLSPVVKAAHPSVTPIKHGSET